MSDESKFIEKLFREYVCSAGTKQVSISQLQQRLQSVSLNKLLKLLSEPREDFHCRAVIHSAAKNGDRELIACIFGKIKREKERFNLLTAKRNGYMAIHWTAGYGRLETIKYLTENVPRGSRTAFFEGKTDGNQTVIYLAAGNGHVCIMDYVLGQLPEQKARDMLQQDTKYGETVIHHAAMYNQVTAMEYLFEKLSVRDWIEILQKQDSKGYTSVMYASERGYMEAVRCLLSKLTADQQLALLRLKENEDRTAMALAIKKEHANIFDYLQNTIIEDKIETLKDKQEDVSHKIAKCSEFEKKATQRILELEKELAVSVEEKKQVEDKLDNYKFQKNDLERNLIQSEKKLRDANQQIKSLTKVTVDLASATKSLAQAKENPDLDERDSNLQGLLELKESLILEQKDTNEKLEQAKSELKKCEERLKELDSKEEERSFLSAKRDECKKAVKKLEGKKEEIKVKLDTIKAKPAVLASTVMPLKIDDSLPSETFQAEQPELYSTQEAHSLSSYLSASEEEDNISGVEDVDGGDIFDLLDVDNILEAYPKQQEKVEINTPYKAEIEGMIREHLLRCKNCGSHDIEDIQTAKDV